MKLRPPLPSQVLSDLAPSFSGVRAVDQARSVELGLSALAFAAGRGEGGRRPALRRGGAFCCKLFSGPDERELRDEATRLFRHVRVVKPEASRGTSAELYLLARHFRPAR